MIISQRAVCASFSLRGLLAIMVLFVVLCHGTNCLAQRHTGHDHGAGNSQQFGGGRAYNFGGFNASAPLGGFNASAPLGGVSSGNGFGTATYSQRNFGTTTYGFNFGGFNGFNYGFGCGTPVIWSTPVYNYSPSVFGYGTGVFSPNFPSGNYISNGYGGLLPFGIYDPWCQTAWPSAVGVNSYFPGTGIAPTVLMLNLNLNLIPMEPATSSYSMLDPRVIDELAPAFDPNELDPNEFEQAPVPELPEPGIELRDAPRIPAESDDVPVLNEFDAVPRDQNPSSLSQKIHSLRYQASGDDAFRKSDYATADVFYATAIRTAPDRRAPYLRMAMVRIALADFPNAASYLKTGLMMESDASRPWCTADELYGQKVAERARSHGAPLWNWLAERPLSADRLLLAGTFQKLRGYHKTADEMLALASHEGPEAILVSEVTRLTSTDIGQRAVSEDLERIIEHASAQNERSDAPTDDAATKRGVEKAGGIYIRGKSVANLNRDTTPAEQPIAGSNEQSDESPIPLKIPQPGEN